MAPGEPCSRIAGGIPTGTLGLKAEVNAQQQEESGSAVSAQGKGTGEWREGGGREEVEVEVRWARCVMGLCT